MNQKKKKQHHNKKTSQPNQTRNLTITSSRECVCLEANWPLVRGILPTNFPSQGRSEPKVNRKRTENNNNKNIDTNKRNQRLSQSKSVFQLKKWARADKFRLIRVRIEKKYTDNMQKKLEQMKKIMTFKSYRLK